MDNCCIGPDCVVLCFSSVRPDNAAAVRAVRRALRSRGYAPWAQTEADVYFSDGQTLILARPRKKICVNSSSAT